MKLSIYSYTWNGCQYGFDLCGALDNWALYANEIVIAVGTSTDATYEVLEAHARERGYPVKLIRTSFDFSTDPFAYGKTVNAALQGCSGDLLISQDMDERIRMDSTFPARALRYLNEVGAKSLFIPTIDLYGDISQYVRVGQKWYMHLPGLYRGAVNFAIKSDGRPDYNKTSTDELIDSKGNLVPTVSMWDGKDTSLGYYVSRGNPLVYHLGYLSLTDRVERAKWWKPFWERASGDPNNHIVDINELLKRETKPHNLPLWTTKT